MTLTVDFIEGIVQGMTPEIEIETVTDNGDGTQTITVCNTYWIRKHLELTISGQNYSVLGFTKDESITLSSTPLITSDSFILQAPYYFHGTPKQVNNQWSIQKIDGDKYPLIYLVEILTDSYYDELDQRDKDMGLRIFFLDSFASNSEEVDTHYTENIVPLNSCLDYFVELLKASPLTLPFSYNVTNRVQVGTYTTDQGNTNSIFEDRLDGVEFVSTVTKLKYSNCKC